MKKFFYYGLLLFSFSNNFCLFKPQRITTAAVEKLPKEWEGSWCFKDFHVTFLYDNGKARFEIRDTKNKLLHYYGDSIKNCYKQSDPEKSDSVYYIAKPRCFSESTNPQRITVQELAYLIHQKKVVFYTGAGISMAAGVWGMPELMKQLKLDQKEKFIDIANKDPEKILESFKCFCNAAFYNAPTKAHLALSEICLSKKIPIITENFDFLHERTGIQVLKMKATKNGFAYDGIKKVLQEQESIVCIGLSHDDRGFLAWFKQRNPNATIVAIDLSQPSYLDKEDFLLEGNLQFLLPKLANLLVY